MVYPAAGNQPFGFGESPSGDGEVSSIGAKQWMSISAEFWHILEEPLVEVAPVCVFPVDKLEKPPTAMAKPFVKCSIEPLPPCRSWKQTSRLGHLLVALRWRQRTQPWITSGWKQLQVDVRSASQNRPGFFY